MKYHILCLFSIIYLIPLRFLVVLLGLKLLQQSPGNHRIAYQDIFRILTRPNSKLSGSSNLEISRA